jgi:hypothetical protein
MTEPSKDKPKSISHRLNPRKFFRAYGADIGLMTIAWNQLHHNLSELFEYVVKSTTPKLSMAVWHSTDSDFTQRKMLRAAVERATHLTDTQRDGITWVLNAIDETLRHRRNDAIHAPVVVNFPLTQLKKAYVAVNERSESPRVIAMKGKDLRAECQLYTKTAIALNAYAHEAVMSIRLGEKRRAWPAKLVLPHARQTKKSPRSSGKARPRPRGSSPA